MFSPIATSPFTFGSSPHFFLTPKSALSTGELVVACFDGVDCTKEHPPVITTAKSSSTNSVQKSPSSSKKHSSSRSTSSIKVDPDAIIEQSRLWQITSHHTSPYFTSLPRLNTHLSIKMKSRRTMESIQTDESLYSSIKYDVLLHFDSGVMRQCPQVLLAKIKVVDDETLQCADELLDEIAVKSPAQATLSRTSSAFTGKFKLCLNKKLSWHKLKKEFRLQIDFCLPNNVDDSILTVRSAPFKTFCRKPDSVLTKRRETSKKRKRTSPNDIGLDHRVTKRGKFEDFKGRLHNLLCMVQHLPQETHAQCYNKIVEKLILNGDISGNEESIANVKKMIEAYESRFLREEPLQ